MKGHHDGVRPADVEHLVSKPRLHQAAWRQLQAVLQGGFQSGALLVTAPSVRGIWDAKATTAVVAPLLSTSLYAAAHLYAFDVVRGIRCKPDLTAYHARLPVPE